MFDTPKPTSTPACSFFLPGGPDSGWALYAGLRRGELVALRWEDVDLKTNRISVERSWDVKAGVIEPKRRR